MDQRASPLIKIDDYEDWPYKVIYASNGSEWRTIDKHLHAFYAERPDIPPHRRPNLIHVAGKYLIVRADRDGVLERNKIEKGHFFILFGAPDVQAITVAVHNIQYRAAHSNHILYDYQFLIDRATQVLRNEPSASEAVT